MRLLIETHHPAHVHFFKHAIREWRERGDEVLVLGRDRDVMRRLLEAYSWIPHRIVTSAGRTNRFPLVEMLQRQLHVASAVLRFRPDAVLSLMGSYTQSATLLGKPNVIFTDSEFQHFNHRIAHPFARVILTPECFSKDLGQKQRRYRGYHELAFLHPTRFEPDPSVLQHMPEAEPGNYVVLRISAWDTLHDVGEHGLGPHLDELLEMLQAQGPVFIVPEGDSLPARWEHLRLQVPAERFHDALAHASLVVTEGASTASECACLGVPSVYVNSTRRGYLDEQEQRYGLVHNFTSAREALPRVRQLLAQPPSSATLAEARQRLLDEHIDVTRHVIDQVDELLGAPSRDKRRPPHEGRAT